MLPIIKNNIQETTTTSGLNDFALLGAVTGYVTFSSQFEDSQRLYYYITNSAGTEWELGLGTYFNNVVERLSVVYSSNSNLFVNFSSGTKNSNLSQ